MVCNLNLNFVCQMRFMLLIIQLLKF